MQRTPEQIKNLRRVLVYTYGIIALFLSDEDVNKWADNFQHEIDAQSGTARWKIKVRVKDDGEKNWKDISEEPKITTSYFSQVTRKCRSLLDKYPNIVSILIVNADDNEEEIVIERKV